MKVVCFIRKRPELTREEFITYYEEKHAPLIASLLPYFSDYRRNYRVDVPGFQVDHLKGAEDQTPPFDVITEWSFENKAMYKKLLAAMADPEVGSVIARDEENFIDRASMKVYVVEEYRSGQS